MGNVEKITIEIEEYKGLLEDRLKYLVILNAVGDLKKIQKKYDKEEKELIELWKKEFQKVNSISDVVEFLISERFNLNIETEGEEGYREYELYCR